MIILDTFVMHDRPEKATNIRVTLSIVVDIRIQESVYTSAMCFLWGSWRVFNQLEMIYPSFEHHTNLNQQSVCFSRPVPSSCGRGWTVPFSLRKTNNYERWPSKLNGTLEKVKQNFNPSSGDSSYISKSSPKRQKTNQQKNLRTLQRENKTKQKT